MKIHLALLAYLLLGIGLNSSAQTVTVEWNNVRQTIDGFGASDGWFTDEMEAHPKREQILDKLFSTTDGIGLSILRQRVSPWVYDDQNAGPDWSHPDFQGSGWMAQQAKNRGVDKVWASCWTPPRWMKSNGKAHGGGTLLNNHYDDYAQWLAQWIQEMKSRHGITYYAISPQNEPGVKPWESCEWTAGDFNRFLRDYLRPEFGNRGLNTRVIAPEETRWDKVDDFADVFMNDNVTKNFVDIIGGHVYGGDPSISYNYYGKPVWETEWSYDTSAEDPSINNGVVWAKNFWKSLVNAEVQSVHHWWLVNFKGDGKQQGLMNGTENDFSTTKRLWTIGNYSRFVRPGWKRIVATKNPTSGVYIAAFRHPTNGKLAIVAINQNNSNQNVTFNFGGFTATKMTPYRTSDTQNLAKLGDINAGSSFSTLLAAKSVTTFTSTGTATTGGSTTWYRLENDGQEHWLQASGGNSGVYTAPQSSTGDFTQWKKVSAGGDWFYLENKGNDQRLKDGPTMVAASNSGNNVQWKEVNAGNGYQRLQNRASGKWLQASGSNNGTYMTGTSSTGAWTKWKFRATGANNARVATHGPDRLETEQYAGNAVRAYPNPASSYLTIQLSAADESALVVLKDMQGRTLVQQQLKSNESLRTSTLSAGLYLIEIHAATHTETRKILINR